MSQESERLQLIALDAIQGWLSKIYNQLVLLNGKIDSLSLPEAQSQQAIAQYTAGQAGPVSDEFLALLVSQLIPSIPAITREIQVSTIPTLIFVNDSRPYLFITVTNDDPAQQLYVSDRSVSINNGRRINAQATIPYVLPQGTSLYGVCIVGSISVRVAEGYDFVKMYSNRQ